MNFQSKLDKIVSENNSLLCIGLDVDTMKIPTDIQELEYPIFEFNKEIIDATHDLVCGYKPNTAFYEGYGLSGIEQLKMTCDYINTKYPQIPIIIDAKRGDIGNTNDGYIKFVFEYLAADAITLHPYMGEESLEPFLAQKDKGIIILCRTSNPGSKELQDLKVDNEKMYTLIAKKVSKYWNINNNCMLVVGATYPDEMSEIRKIVGDMTLLVPGIGAQGGDIEKTVEAGVNSKGAGMIINSGRAIIYASNNEDFAQKAREEAIKTRDEINKHRS